MMAGRQPAGGPVSSDEAARRAAYRQEVRKAGGHAGLLGYALMFIGLAIALAGRYLPGQTGLRFVGLGFFFPALACFLIVLVNRRRWRRDHPFNG